MRIGGLIVWAAIPLLALYLNATYHAVSLDGKALCILVLTMWVLIAYPAKEAGAVNLKTYVLRQFQFHSAEKRVNVQHTSVLNVCTTQIHAYSTEEGINLRTMEILVSEVVNIACKCNRDFHWLTFFHFWNLTQLHIRAVLMSV